MSPALVWVAVLAAGAIGALFARAVMRAELAAAWSIVADLGDVVTEQDKQLTALRKELAGHRRARLHREVAAINTATTAPPDAWMAVADAVREHDERVAARMRERIAAEAQAYLRKQAP